MIAGVDTTTPAVVLSVHDHGGLGAVRTLGRLGVEVHGTFLHERDPVRSSRYLRSSTTWDLDREPVDASVAFLRSLGDRIGGRPVLLASEDASAIFVAEQAEQLRESFRVPDQPPHLARTVADKRGLHELCESVGVPSPATVFPATVEEVAERAPALTYPVVVKAIDGWLLRGISEVKTIVAADEAELLGCATAMAVGDDLNAMLQEYVPGGADSIWTFQGYAEAGEVLLSFVGNKQREYPVDRGLTTLTVCAVNDEVQRLARRLIAATGYTGVIDLDFRFDARDGRYKALDFNPRPGANFRAFVDTAGVDVVRAAYLRLTGQALPAGAPQPGRRWMVEHWDLAAARRYVAEDRLTPRAWLGSLRGVRETAWWAADDPLPFARTVARFAGTGARWALRRTLSSGGAGSASPARPG